MTPEQIELERQAFEAWYCFGNPNDKCFAKNEIGNYSNPCTVIAFNVWLARAAQSAWISVEDRQPEPYKRVLVALSNGSIEVDRHIPDDDPTMEWINCGSHVYVTHWQPLPEPPKAA